MEMPKSQKSVLLLAMPFAGCDIPSIQLAVLESYLREKCINIKTSNLFLKAAGFYGVNNYNLLVYPPNDSYTAQMFFSRYVFPDHWKQNEQYFRDYFQKMIPKNIPKENLLSFDQYVQQTDEFLKWTINSVEWKKHDIIGFTLNYGQLLPSLAVAKKIKNLDPQKKIVLGGSRTTGEMGEKTLSVFDYVDYIVSGEGEEALFQLCWDYNNYETITGLIYRKGYNIIWNKPTGTIDLNNQTMPNYDPFFDELKQTTPDVQQFFSLYGRLPVEISRGCWWNKCSFCNLNIQHKQYREKNVDKIIDEIQFLSDRYKILNFQIIGNTLPIRDYRELFNKIKQIGKDFTFTAETRAGRLQSQDYTLMKEAGFNIIQTGIESFSPSYLKKMNKGTRVIDNIAVLKFCKENNITNRYNLIVNYPNEDSVDYEETQKNIELFKTYLDPPQICQLRVLHGSPIQLNPEQYNMKQLTNANIDTIMFPPDILKDGFNFVYDFKKNHEQGENNWEQLIQDWRQTYENLKLQGMRTHSEIDKYVFYYVDGENFLKIYDKRNPTQVQMYVLDEQERAIFLSCTDVISYNELQEKFSNIPDYHLAAVLHSFEKNGIVFREDNYYLSLPLDYKKCLGITKEKKFTDNLVKEEIVK
jgi:ribosomal peptide maturation radical SAM protein 1